MIAVAGAGIIWRMSPSRGRTGTAATPDSAATPAGVNIDSIAEVERQMQSEVAVARQQAMAAEHRADSIAAASRTRGATGAPQPSHAHLYVFAQGGTPRVVLDGQQQDGVTPTVLQVSPGPHRISVRGLQAFAPAETTITLAAEDTQTVIFRADRRGGRQGQASGFITHDPATGRPVVDWPAVINKLGFDPRTANPRALTPQQRLAYRRFQQVMDSARRNMRRP